MKHTFRAGLLICFFVCIIVYMVLPLFSNESGRPQGQFRAVLIEIDEYEHRANEENFAKLDYCVKERLHHRCYTCSMDDFVLGSRDRNEIVQRYSELESFLIYA